MIFCVSFFEMGAFNSKLCGDDDDDDDDAKFNFRKNAGVCWRLLSAK